MTATKIERGPVVVTDRTTIANLSAWEAPKIAAPRVPPTPAQLTAWRQLWGRLLEPQTGQKGTEH
jgi:hypothetical protein